MNTILIKIKVLFSTTYKCQFQLRVSDLTPFFIKEDKSNAFAIQCPTENLNIDTSCCALNLLDIFTYRVNSLSRLLIFLQFLWVCRFLSTRCYPEITSVAVFDWLKTPDVYNLGITKGEVSR
jgi:hypothetical protein